jgi:hypothetical protein
LEFGAWNLELGIWNLEFGTWNLRLTECRDLSRFQYSINFPVIGAKTGNWQTGSVKE